MIDWVPIEGEFSCPHFFIDDIIVLKPEASLAHNQPHIHSHIVTRGGETDALFVVLWSVIHLSLSNELIAR